MRKLVYYPPTNQQMTNEGSNMFTYQISPETPEERPILISVRVQGSAVTLYVRGRFDEFNSRQNQPFANAEKGLAECVYQYTSNSAGRVRGVKEEANEHQTMHTADAFEADVLHCHVKHKKQVTLKNLQKLLDFLMKCESTKNVASGQTFLTHSVRKDILRQFKNYLETSNRENLGNYITYNSHNCSQLPMTNTSSTISLHEQYISSSAANPSPCKPIASSESESPSTALLSTIGVVSLVTLGFFAYKMKCSTVKQQSATAVPALKKGA